MSVREYGDDLLTRLLQHGVRDVPGAVGAGLLMAEAVPSRPGRQTSGAENSAPPTAVELERGVRILPRVASGVAEDLDAAQVEVAAPHLWQALKQVVVLEEPRLHVPLPGPLGWDSVTGLVVVPGEWGGSLPLLFTVYLKELPDEAALAEIASLEQVLSQAVAVVEAAAGQEQRADQMLRMSQYRRVVEQAKGMVMAAVPTDSASAFSVLSRASQHFNVRLRHLAVALVEHVGTGPAEHPDDDAERVEPSEHDRTVAAQVWRALQAGAQQSDPGDPAATEASWRA